VNIDAAPSLKLWAVTVTAGGRAYRIPPLPAADWLRAIASPSLGQVFPGMIPDSEVRDEVLDALLEGGLSLAEWHRAAHDAIAAISGTKWWSATRLTRYLLDNWGTVGGAVIARGMDPSTAPLGAVLTLTYRILLENCKDEGERRKLDIELDKPPVGVPVAEMFDQRQAAANFMALADAPG
jgi:hypothetical protein